MKIKNTEALARTSLRAAALRIAEAGYAAVDTPSLVAQRVLREGNILTVCGTRFTLGAGRLILVGAGKCSADAASALEPILGDRLAAGAVIDTRTLPLKKIVSYEGTHPLPSEQNMLATSKVLRLVSGLREEDTVIAVISGGGSTLLCLPAGGRDCAQEIALVEALFRKGATIEELNTVRKHTSLVRGGFLAKAAHPARVIGLIFSDVPGDDLAYVASGPTVKDATTVEDARGILAKYDLDTFHPLEETLIETPKEDEYFARVTNIVMVSNVIALEAMRDEASRRGFEAQIITNTLAGEAREIGMAIVKMLHAAPPHAAFLYGGEPTVHITGGGEGGRAEEVSLAGLAEVREDELLLPFASDGRDNTDFAGGICDIMTKRHAEEKKLDVAKFLAENDSYRFFAMAGDYLETGPTGSNVSDLIIAMKE